MKIYLATWLEDNQGIGLTEVGYKNRLMSYHFIRMDKNKNFDLRIYVKKGISKKGGLKRSRRKN
jgi:hypothetical protein